jgi:uncharacterized protein YvpB
MRYKAIIAALTVGLAAAAVCTDYFITNEKFSERIAENDRYTLLGADPHALYGGFTVEELGENYDKPSALLGKVSVDVPLIDQYPELPVGCEPSCAAAVLQMLGFETDKLDFTDNYLGWDDNFYYDKHKQSHGPDPRKVFAGNPYKWGYGCTSEVLAESMNRFFDEKAPSAVEYRAMALEEDLNSADIEKLLDEGVPIIVWATIDMKPLNYRKPSEWYIDGTAEKYTWYGNSHTLVLCGYDTNCYYFMDPNEKKDITAYMKTSFLNRFEDNGFQAVVVKITKFYAQ